MEPPGPRTLLRVDLVERTFDDATNSYKFFWLLALLDELEAGSGPRIALPRLLAGMLAQAARFVKRANGTFGAQDRLPELLERLCLAEGVSPDASPEDIRSAVLRRLGTADRFARELASLADYVPFRFLRPFFGDELRGAYDRAVNERITALAGERFSGSEPPVYRFVESPEQAVELHPAWMDYLRTHAPAVRAFVEDRLLRHLGIGDASGLALPRLSAALETEPPAVEREVRMAAEERAPYDAGAQVAPGSWPKKPWWRRRNGNGEKARRSWVAWLRGAFRRLFGRSRSR